MLKQSLFVLLASFLVVALTLEIAFVLHFMDKLHLLLEGSLGKIFAGGTIGSLDNPALRTFNSGWRPVRARRHR